MKWNIVTDSSCDISTRDNKLKGGIPFFKVPFLINAGKRVFVDDHTMNIDEMLFEMENGDEICKTACPSPEKYAELFKRADNTIAITISSALSGSYNSAMLARETVLEDHPSKNIFVLDSKSAGSALSMFAYKAEELILENEPFDRVRDKLIEYASRRHTVFALSSFTNLIRNGRMSKPVGFIAGLLGIWGIGSASSEGKINIIDKVRGAKRAVESIITDMKANCFERGEVIITHCKNSELAQKIAAKIKEHWCLAQVKIMESGGLCSFYAERNGLIVAY